MPNAPVQAAAEGLPNFTLDADPSRFHTIAVAPVEGPFDIRAMCRRNPDYVPVHVDGTLWAAASSQLDAIRPSPEAVTARDYVEGLEALGFTFHIQKRDDGSETVLRGEPEDPLPESWDRRALDIMATFGSRKTGEEVLTYLRKRDADRAAAHPDAALFALEKEYKEAMVRYEVASRAHREAEERYFAVRPAPIDNDARPDDLEVEAWEKADQQASREAGVDRAETPMNALLDKADAIARKIIRMRAHTPDGMLLKARVNAASAVEEHVLHAALLKDLRAAAKREGAMS